MITKVLIIDEKDIFTGEHKQQLLEKGLKIVGIIKSEELNETAVKNTMAEVIVIFSLKKEKLQETFSQTYKVIDTPAIVLSEIEFNRDIFKFTKNNVVDFISIGDYDNINQYYDMLEGKIDTATKAKIIVEKEIKPVRKPQKLHFQSSSKKIIVIASSTGGPPMIEQLLSEMPENTPAPILIVQHMPIGFTKPFAERLNSKCAITVKEAESGEELKNGVALIAPAGFHMELRTEIEGYEGTITLNELPKENGVRPAADRLFSSVSTIFKGNTIGVVLTGMGHDGLSGSRTIKDNQGTILAQSEKTCVIYGMPKCVVDADLADEILDIDNITVALLQLLDL